MSVALVTVIYFRPPDASAWSFSLPLIENGLPVYRCNFLFREEKRWSHRWEWPPFFFRPWDAFSAGGFSGSNTEIPIAVTSRTRKMQATIRRLVVVLLGSCAHGA
jgi:hypothetical protein